MEKKEQGVHQGGVYVGDGGNVRGKKNRGKWKKSGMQKKYGSKKTVDAWTDAGGLTKN